MSARPGAGPATSPVAAPKRGGAEGGGGGGHLTRRAKPLEVWDCDWVRSLGLGAIYTITTIRKPQTI